MHANTQVVKVFLAYRSRFIVQNSMSGYTLIPAFYQLRATVGSDPFMSQSGNRWMSRVCDAQCDSSRLVASIEGSVAESENRRVTLTVDEMM